MPGGTRLCPRLIAGRKVGDDGGPGQRVERGGRQSAPQILTDLHAQHKAGHLAAAEEQRGAKGHLLAADGNRFHLGAARGELALFVKFAVVGQVGLGHQAQQLALAEDSGAVVQFAPYQQRQAYQSHHVQLFAGVQNALQPGQRSLLEGALQKQVAAGVAREAELREDRQLDAPARGLTQLGDDLLGVIHAVRHPQGGGKGCGFQKTIFHRRISHPVCFDQKTKEQGPGFVLIVYHNLPQTKSNSWETGGKTCKNKKSRRVAAAAPKAIKVENEIDRKPGSVLNDDLSRPAIADRFVPPSGHASSAVRPI